MADVKLDVPYPYSKQIQFFKATSKYVAYGGARGGGKSWAARVKATLLALNYSGIQILLLRRTLQELRENHILPLLKTLKGIAKYKEQTKEFTFPNGSRIVLGYCDSEKDVLQYQGQAYEVIFLEEATQFTEFQFQSLTESNRSSGLCKSTFYPRIYLTCNPGGVGHVWVKRLFIDRDYIEKERSEDYTFIKALVYDNSFLMDNSPDYVRTLENLPLPRRKAMLFGDWDIFVGQFFTDFRRDIHVIQPFEIPSHWRWYFTMDYGGDMAAFYWIAVDEQGNAFVTDEFSRGLDSEGDRVLVPEAAKVIKDRTHGRQITYLAPHDMFNTSIQTGRSIANMFAAEGINLVQTSKDRVAGWNSLLSLLKPFTDVQGQTVARLRIFDSCRELIRTLPMLQRDDKNPDDVARNPHDITHFADSIRCFSVWWTAAANALEGKRVKVHRSYMEDYNNASEEARQIIRERLGARPYCEEIEE